MESPDTGHQQFLTLKQCKKFSWWGKEMSYKEGRETLDADDVEGWKITQGI